MSNQTIISNPDELPHDELIEEYARLSRLYTELKESDDVARQTIYELRRNLQLANTRESFLTHELESMNEQHDADLQKKCDKQRDDIAELHRRLIESTESVGNLESEIDELRRDLAEAITRQATPSPSPAMADDSVLSDNQKEYLAKLEAENTQLIDAYSDMNGKSLETLRQLSELQQTVDTWKDRCECAEENLMTKRSELDEQRSLVEALQEKVVHLSSELAAFNSDAADINKKGNSLFAEVDDQRQYMRNLLAKQKLQYNKMKLDHADSQRQIRMLKRENGAMRREVEICSQMFKQADRFHKNKLLDRIYYLGQEVEQLQSKLKRTEQQLVTFARENDANWISATLDQCRLDTEKLKAELNSCRLQKADVEDKYFIAMEQQSKWRFEALKSRCIIIERESLLEDNKIDFEPLDNIEVNSLVNAKYLNVSQEVPLIDCASPVGKQCAPREDSAGAAAKPHMPPPRIVDVSIQVMASDQLDRSAFDADATIVLMPGESFLGESVAAADSSSNEVEIVDASPSVAPNTRSVIAITPQAQSSEHTAKQITPPQAGVAAAELDDSLSPLRMEEATLPMSDVISPPLCRQANILQKRDENVTKPVLPPKEVGMNISILSTDESPTLPQYRPIKINASRLDFIHKNVSAKSAKENDSNAVLMPPPSTIGGPSTSANPVKYARKVRPVIKHMKIQQK